jgi:hypothetical protein
MSASAPSIVDAACLDTYTQRKRETEREREEKEKSRKVISM